VKKDDLVVGQRVLLPAITVPASRWDDFPEGAPDDLEVPEQRATYVGNSVFLIDKEDRIPEDYDGRVSVDETEYTVI